MKEFNGGDNISVYTPKCIENKESNGYLYNEYLVEKMYNKLKVPTQFYRPPFEQLTQHKYFIALSERSTGKTNNWLLYGLCKYWLYGCQIVYVRARDEEITPKFANEIFGVILSYENSKYIRILTDGKFNTIVYKSRKFYLALLNDEGKVEFKDDTPFMHIVAVDSAMNLKSTFNVPHADLILFDEFIGKRYAFNECIQFLDLCKTIIRQRFSPIIVMLANTIDLNSEYFYELEIKRAIKDMTFGDKRSVKSEKGTPMYVEIIAITETEEKKKRRQHSALFFGFKNPKLASITGDGDVWAFDHVPHIVKYDREGNEIEKTVIDYRPMYIRSCDELLKLTFMYSEILGNFLEITKATYIKNSLEQPIIFVDNTQDITYNNEFKSLARGSKIFNTIMKYITYGKIYFQNNEIGNIFYKYIDNIE